MADKKIIIYGKHFATIDNLMWEKLCQFAKINNLTEFIKQNVLFDFGINIQGSQDIEELDKVLPQFYYQSKKEWLNQKIRTVIFEYECKNHTSNEIVSYFYVNDKKIHASKNLTKEFILEVVKNKSLLKRIERNYMRIENAGGEKPETITFPLFSAEFFFFNEYYLYEEEKCIIYEALKDTDYWMTVLEIPAFKNYVSHMQ